MYIASRTNAFDLIATYTYRAVIHICNVVYIMTLKPKKNMLHHCNYVTRPAKCQYLCITCMGSTLLPTPLPLQRR
jgi:hypothetical protein